MGTITRSILCACLSAVATEPQAPARWLDGEHLTGEWKGDRDTLADHGITIDLIYTAETFLTTARLGTAERAVSLLGHLDAALTLDTQKLGLWRGGKFYFLGQNNHGVGINALVSSGTSISNLEAPPYTQLTEFFYEQLLFGKRLRLRLGKQDANRDFGTPRYGGNFLNNNYGMFPTTPLPSYPTTGLGAVVVVEPTDWLALKAAVCEGNPKVGSLGFDSALAENGGLTTVVGTAITHRFGIDKRNGGTTSVGAWRQTGQIAEVSDAPMARTFSSNWGLLVQNDERLYSDPSNEQNNGGLNVIVRFAWSQPDRNQIPLYFGASAAWHGVTSTRDNDTIGIGFGYFTVSQQTGGTLGPGSEVFVEAFYKMRLTNFFSLQPDVELYQHPGGDGPTTLLVGLRLKLKL